MRIDSNVKNLNLWQPAVSVSPTGVTVLAGGNGSGKSSVMQALALALTGRTGDLSVREDGASWATLGTLAPEGAESLFSDVTGVPTQMEGRTTTHSFRMFPGGRGKLTAGDGAFSWVEGISLVREYLFNDDPLKHIRALAPVRAAHIIAEADEAAAALKAASKEQHELEIAVRRTGIPSPLVNEAGAAVVAAKRRLNEARLNAQAFLTGLRLTVPGVRYVPGEAPQLILRDVVVRAPSGAQTSILEARLAVAVGALLRPHERMFVLARDRSLDSDHYVQLCAALKDAPFPCLVPTVYTDTHRHMHGNAAHIVTL